MENGSNENKIEDFLRHRNTKDLFAKLDYSLKDGVHIQQAGNQIELYNYIVNNEESLKLYYKDLFKINLSSGGEIPRKYYFLDFESPNDRGKITSDNRHFLKNEYVIIGLIIYEVLFIHKEIELNSISKLKEKIRIDYDDIKPGLYRLIAKSNNLLPSNLNDDAIDRTIKNALNEFSKIGWFTISNDEFEPLPAFDRLINFYEKEIQDIDEILKELK
ncbi:hypothetical protein Q4Q39_01955 [Flavivirga amylovorans]|uniref:DUF4194 domain-containing protein n=1 Tax=Flavivirga amylovorans TaxID=870486 RepID=A0ABT8WXT3_9FLAO|nr:hypothetical protein [Flavivirga amylovorans]MDO5986155.1 hypothetical protein [Flavivirga amylovorans]